MRKIHMSLNIRGFLSNSKFPQEYKGLFTHDDGREMSPEEARNALFDEIAKGHECIRFGACDNFDPKGAGCLGHDLQPTPE